jgi:hypothetical protein
MRGELFHALVQGVIEPHVGHISERQERSFRLRRDHCFCLFNKGKDLGGFAFGKIEE